LLKSVILLLVDYIPLPEPLGVELPDAGAGAELELLFPVDDCCGAGAGLGGTLTVVVLDGAGVGWTGCAGA
jgi:hypothetical protein